MTQSDVGAAAVLDQRRVTLDHEERGPEGGPAVVVIPGLGSQRVWYPEAFLDGLADGRRVVSLDNRDMGPSPWCDDLPADPAMLQALLADTHDGTPPPYALADLAADVVALLDELGVERAHVVGASMGGMVAQHLGFGWPERVRSLAVLMSTTGAREVSQSTPEAQEVLLTPLPDDDVEEHVRLRLEASRVIGSPGRVDTDAVEARSRVAFDRGCNQAGTLRQLLAILSDGDRTGRLATVSAPTLVIHGGEDPLLPPEGGRALADAIAGAELLEIEGMGHDLPPSLVPAVVEAITGHHERVEDAEREA